MPATTASAHRAPRTPNPRHSEAYIAYLASPEWATKRAAALARAGHHCAVCGATEGLEVHHLNYEWLGEEAPEDLQVLCKPHHDIADRRRRALAAVTRNEGGW